MAEIFERFGSFSMCKSLRIKAFCARIRPQENLLLLLRQSCAKYKGNNGIRSRRVPEDTTCTVKTGAFPQLASKTVLALYKTIRPYRYCCERITSWAEERATRGKRLLSQFIDTVSVYVR